LIFVVGARRCFKSAARAYECANYMLRNGFANAAMLAGPGASSIAFTVRSSAFAPEHSMPSGCFRAVGYSMKSASVSTIAYVGS
jgi:hypothetical protein